MKLNTFRSIAAFPFLVGVSLALAGPGEPLNTFDPRIPFIPRNDVVIFPTKIGQSVKPQFRTNSAQSQRAICSQVSNEYGFGYKTLRPIQK